MKEVLMKWSYGVTTVPSRAPDLLPATLASLTAAGFGAPRLFVDGASAGYVGPATYRDPAVGAYANWALALGELYLRSPSADFYAVFQDDFVCYRNLRQYLERTCRQPFAYWNLYTFPCNEGPRGWHETNQLGKGAVALAFSNPGARALLSSKHAVDRAMDAFRGHKYIDGGVVSAMNGAGYREHAHTPSLVQHVGGLSTLGNKPHPQANSFLGESYDASGGFGV